jgi:signal transduction histidine kinase
MAKKTYLPRGVRARIAKTLFISLSAVDQRLRRSDPEAVRLAVQFCRQVREDQKDARALIQSLRMKDEDNGNS